MLLQATGSKIPAATAQCGLIGKVLQPCRSNSCRSALPDEHISGMRRDDGTSQSAFSGGFFVGTRWGELHGQ